MLLLIIKVLLVANVLDTVVRSCSTLVFIELQLLL